MNIDLETELRTADRAYGALALAVEADYLATETAASTKIVWDQARAKAISEGIIGKNAEEREANLRLELANEYERLAAAERGVREARYRAEDARLEVERLRLRVRLLELAAGQERVTA